MASRTAHPSARRPNIMATRHVVSAGHYLAAQAGFQVLEAGGNAIDAGVAAGITLNIVEPHMCCFGGVAPTIVYLAATGEIVTVDGLGTWPRAASCELFQRRSPGPVPEGILQSVVPAAPDAWLTLLERYGTISFGDAARAAIRFARAGFPVQPHLSASIKERIAEFQSQPESAAIFLPNGRAPETGDLFVQTDLAGTLQFLFDEERRAANRGREAGLQAVARGFLCRGHRCHHRQVPQGKRWVADRRGFGRVSGHPRAGRLDTVPRHRCLQLRAVVSGADVAPAAQPVERS